MALFRFGTAFGTGFPRFHEISVQIQISELQLPQPPSSPIVVHLLSRSRVV